MKRLCGPLYRLKTSGFEADLDMAQSPLGQVVNRSIPFRKSRKGLRSAVLSHRNVSAERSSSAKPFHAHQARVSHSEGNLLANLDEPLGSYIADWGERGFELCHVTCELRYHCSRLEIAENESKHAPGMLALGFVQEHTKVCTGPPIETVDRNLETAEKLRLYTIEIGFALDTSIYPKFYILGHPEESERDRWLLAIQVLIERKLELFGGWKQYCRQNIVSEADKTEEWLRHRSGEVSVKLNLIARRRARLQNGKVLQDVPKIFESFSEAFDAHDCSLDSASDWAYWGQASKKRFMHVSVIVPALAELGLELLPKVGRRVVEEAKKNPPLPTMTDMIDLSRFELIFRSCCVELLVSPSAEMKQNLMRIMQTSKNPFLSLLSPAEQMYLIEGQDADGRCFCTCKNYEKNTVLVQQGDEGDSLFIIIDGNLSIVVTFGSGSSTTQKEVAVLPSGSVMGEMSLVLGKPRSATCVVKSESASVAEVAKSAMVRLLEARPSLARELEDIVHRRDTANYLNAGKTADAMAAYRQRGGAAAVFAAASRKSAAAAAKANGGGVGGGMRPSAGGAGGAAAAGSAAAPGGGRQSVDALTLQRGGEEGKVLSRPVSRIQSRTAKAPPRARAQTPNSLPGLPYRMGSESRGGDDGGGNVPVNGGHKIKSGRWVKCRGVYVFVVD